VALVTWRPRDELDDDELDDQARGGRLASRDDGGRLLDQAPVAEREARRLAELDREIDDLVRTLPEAARKRAERTRARRVAASVDAPRAPGPDGAALSEDGRQPPRVPVLWLREDLRHVGPEGFASVLRYMTWKKRLESEQCPAPSPDHVTDQDPPLCSPSESKPSSGSKGVAQSKGATVPGSGKGATVPGSGKGATVPAPVAPKRNSKARKRSAAAWSGGAHAMGHDVPTMGTPWVQVDRYGDPVEVCKRLRRKLQSRCYNDCAATRGHGHQWLAWAPCKLLDCATCQKAKSDARGLALYRRFAGMGTGHWVFTVPREWHPHLGLEALFELRRRIVEVLTAWTYDLTDGVRGWLVMLHPEGDERPGVWEPHFHVFSPLLAVDVTSGEVMEVDQGWRIGPGYITPGDLDDLKSRWALVLHELAEAGGWETPGVNLHYSFETDPTRILHHIAYDCRSFPGWNAGDLAEWAQRVGEFGLASPHYKGVDSTGHALWRALVAPGALGPAERPEQEDADRGVVCPCCLSSLEVISVGDEHEFHGLMMRGGVPMVPAHRGGAPPPRRRPTRRRL
jgi:hypothetical protein